MIPIPSAWQDQHHEKNCSRFSFLSLMNMFCQKALYHYNSSNIKTAQTTSNLMTTPHRHEYTARKLFRVMPNSSSSSSSCANTKVKFSQTHFARIFELMTAWNSPKRNSTPSNGYTNYACETLKRIYYKLFSSQLELSQSVVDEPVLHSSGWKETLFICMHN